MSTKELLLIDDDASVHEALAPVLALEGIAVHSARSALEAETILGSSRFDLVVVDLSLTGSTGQEGLDLITASRRLAPATPVVLFTARGTSASYEKARERGAAATWSKAMPIGEFVRRVVEIATDHPKAIPGARP
jgi:DNA-binding NtrC family response regulator